MEEREMSNQVRQSRIVRWFAQKIVDLNSYTVEVDVSDECQRCGADDAPVPVCNADGYFEDYCQTCAREVTGLD